MNRRQALTYARRILAENNIDDASLEGEILLRHVIGLNRTQLYTDLGSDISRAHEKALNKLLERRLLGEPSAYITGHREFYGLDLQVNRDVLIPRPETELLVEKAIHLTRSRAMSRIADIGTGCGAIAIGLAVNLSGVALYASDISAPALEVAHANCAKHGVTDRIVLLQGHLLEPLPEPVDLIIANLPYVREADLTDNSLLSFEPGLALGGGEDGLDMIRELCRQAGNRLRSQGCILMEIGQGQSEAVAILMQESFASARIEVESDTAGIERLVSLCLTRHRT